MATPRKPELEALARAFLAMVGTVALAAAAAWLFTTRDPSTSRPVSQRLPTAAALPLVPPPISTPAEREPEWINDLRAWLRLMDPALLPLPTDASPINRSINDLPNFRLTEFIRPHHTFRPGSTAPHVVAWSAPGIPPLVAFPSDPVAAIEASRRFRPPDMDVIVPGPYAAPADRVVITDRFERIAHDAPPIPLDQVTATGVTEVDGPSIVYIQPRGFGARIQLISSCGATALDDLAIRHFHAYARRLQTISLDPGEEKAWLDSEHVYQIYWRHLPGISLRPYSGAALDLPAAPPPPRRPPEPGAAPPATEAAP